MSIFYDPAFMRAQPAATSESQGQEEILRLMARADNYNAWLLDRSRPYLGRRVLDVGAGLGTFTELVAGGRDLVVAVEPEVQFAAELRKRFADRPNVVVVESHADELDGEHGPFDSVICFNVLEHIADDGSALRAFHSRLAPGGHLLLLVPAHPFLFGAIDRTVHHERRYKREALRRRLEQLGFSVRTIRYVNPLGALGWLVSGRVLGRGGIPTGPLGLYDNLVPLLRTLDRVQLPFGLSVWAVARRVG